MNRFDAIIIGSGLGSLECGAILAKDGWNVCVLEKNRLFGGCLQTYERYGRKLDTGLHYFGSIEEGQLLNQCFRYFGIMDRLRLKKMDEDCYDRILYKGRTYDYAMGDERFTDVLAREFPGERAGLEKYVREIKKVGNLVGVDKLRNGKVSSEESFDVMHVSASEMIAGCVKDPVLRNVLAGTCLLYGGMENISSFYEHGMIASSYMGGAYRCVDGSMQIAEELVGEIRRHGGTVLNNSPVDSILVEGNRVRGVRLQGSGEIMEADNFISGIHPVRTMSLLDSHGSIKPAYIDRLKSIENTYGIFSAYFLMKEGTLPYLNYNVYIHENDNVWYDKNRSRDYRCCMLSMQPSSNDGTHANVVSVLTPMCIDELKEWENTLPERRGEAYLRFKETRIGELAAMLARHGFGDIMEAEHICSTTPLSYRDFTGTIDGSAYGFVKDWHSPLRSIVSPRTKLSNLYLTGQNLNVHGVLGVTLTSIMTCSALLGEEYITKKIGYA